jgi:tetratricopeptide (TPR) repeat protein
MLPDIYIEGIQAIGALWKLVAACALLLGIIFLRKPLQQVILRLRNVRVKKGQDELCIETQAEETEKAATASPEDEKQDPAKLPQPEMPTPNEPGTIFFEMLGAFEDGKFEEADQAFEKLQKAEDDGVSKLRNQAFYYWLRYRYGRDAQAVQRLEELTKKDDIREIALWWIAVCHEFSMNYAKAIDAHTRALSGQLSSSERSRHAVGLAMCHVAMGDAEAGLKVLSFALQNGAAAAEVYKGIADVHEKTGNSTLRAIALQKVLEFSPEDPQALFDAAYSQGAAKMSRLCVVNYRTLLEFQPTHCFALNNLGVKCETLELPIRSVAYYKRAVEQGETLAMSNLAHRYMNQGFDSEAQSLLDTARKADHPHKNIGMAMSNLADNREKEAEAWKKIIAEGVRQQEFFCAYGDAYFVPSDAKAPFAGEWVSQSGRVFIITQNDSTVCGKWEIEKEGEKFEGTAHNLAAQVKYQTKASSLGGLFSGPVAWGASEDGFACISQDGSTIRLHTFDERKVFFSTLKRKQKEPHAATV